MKNFLHFDQFSHDLRLINVSRNPVEDENVDVRLELVRVDRGVDRFLPKLDRDVVRDELSLAGVFEKSFPNFCARIDGAKHVAARAMKKTWNCSERFALRAFAAARRTKQDERAVFHESNWLYRNHGESGRETVTWQ